LGSATRFPRQRLDLVNAPLLLRLAGVGLVLIGVFLPRGWYDRLPWGPELPPQPIKGVTLLQVAFVCEGLVLMWLSWRSLSLRVPPVSRPRIPPPTHADATDGRCAWWLAAVTTLALGLRLFRVDSDLWLDEISPLFFYGHLNPLEVIATYLRSNNHLLNTLLVNLCVSLFGEDEWVVRLPAVLVGTATVPALYWVGRLALTPSAALGAALLLAVSYHHIFFSQNARGYAGYMLFAIIGARWLAHGLASDRNRDWALYVASLFLGFAMHLLTAFVAAGGVLTGLLAIAAVRRRNASPWPLLRRLAVVFGVAALLVFHLYAAVIPQAYVVAGATYASPTTGFRPLSGEFVQELLRGISEGFGPGLVLGALPFLALGGAGIAVLGRRHWVLVAALGLPLAVTAAVLAARGFTFSPRFFLLGLPLAMLGAVRGLWTIGEHIAARGAMSTRSAERLAGVAVLALTALSLAALPSYYARPKQDYRGAIRFLEASRRPGEPVIIWGVAEMGFRFYLRHEGIDDESGYVYARTEADLEEALARHPAGRAWFTTTFVRNLRMRTPELAERLRSDWRLAGTFRGTVGDGNILVWSKGS
jgi:4-amino-4-deoxy-L-arabinose transferase-like glycosyltransferase